MAVTLESVGTGLIAPSALSLQIDAGARPGGSLTFTSYAGREIRARLDHADLLALTNALVSEPRLRVDTSKWSHKDRAQYDAKLEELLRGLKG